MFSSIWNDIKREFSYGNMMTRMIIVNVAIFVVMNLIMFSFSIVNRGDVPILFNQMLHFFCVGKSWEHNLYHPWTPFTYMFLHLDFWHILFNMLTFYWFGRIVGDLIGNHRILPIYILGGLAGALIYFLSANYFQNIGPYALGASASVMAIAVVAGVIAPDYEMRLIIFGDVKLKYIVGLMLLLDMIGTTTSNNSGGHWAHLGGAIMGYFFAKRLHAGQDLGLWINQFVDWVTNFRWKATSKKTQKRPKPHMAYKNEEKRAHAQRDNTMRGFNSTDPYNQERLNIILDKIKLSGYDSLGQEEKEFLFRFRE